MNQPAIAITQEPPLMSFVKKTRRAAPIRTCLYGVPGLGKSTFAAAAPDPVFLAAENGLTGIDAEAFEPTSWAQALRLMERFATEPHGYKTFVIDTVSWLEQLVHEATCVKHKKKSMSDFEFGKGPNYAFEEWKPMRGHLEAMWKRGMNIIILAHSHTAKVKNPAGADYGIITMKLDAPIDAYLREWSDAVLYCEYQTFEVGGDSKRAKVISDGARLVHTQHRGAFNAKNRYNLPELIPLEWSAFAEAVAQNRPADPDVTKAKIATMLEGADEALKTKVNAAVEKNSGDAVMLARIANHLAAQIGIKENA
jgi:hypothetical protein